ncbi:hypothetical protein GOV05_01870 [Candidatus Woesearchaeota archaeon]|nr:hypothetical protein [Candidatus Woesearchaeota archaeon]
MAEFSKPEGGIYNASAEDLTKHIDTYFSEDKGKERSKIKDRKKQSVGGLTNIINGFLIGKRGGSDEHKGAPKAYHLENDAESGELLHKLAEESFKQEYGQAALDATDKDRVIEHLENKLGQDYFTMRRKMWEDPNFLRDGMDDLVEKLAFVDDEYHLQKVQQVLVQNSAHHDHVRSKAGKASGATYKSDAHIPEVLNDYINVVAGGKATKGDIKYKVDKK